MTLWITLTFGFACGFAARTAVNLIRRYRAQRQHEIELQHWRVISLFRW